jgi:hypothetical protein
MLDIVTTSHKVKGGWAGKNRGGSLFLSTVEGVGHRKLMGGPCKNMQKLFRGTCIKIHIIKIEIKCIRIHV